MFYSMTSAETTLVTAVLHGFACVVGHTPDIGIYSKFHQNLFSGEPRGVGGTRNLAIPITLAIGLLHPD